MKFIHDRAPGIYAPDGEEPNYDKLIKDWMEENPEEGYTDKWTDEDLAKVIPLRNSKNSPFIKDNKEF